MLPTGATEGPSMTASNTGAAGKFASGAAALGRWLLLVVVAWCSGVVAQPAPEAETAVEPGATIAEVVEKLGRPNGIMKIGQLTTYQYERGMVDFVSGRVVRAFLLSSAEAERRRLAREQAEAEARQRAEAERERLAAAGAAERARALSDPRLVASTPAERLAFWEEFSRRYPFTPVDDLLVSNRVLVAENVRQREREAELAAIATRMGAIRERFRQLEAEYAASLTHWKRRELDAERAALTEELGGLELRLKELAGPVSGQGRERGEGATNAALRAGGAD